MQRGKKCTIYSDAVTRMLQGLVSIRSQAENMQHYSTMYTECSKHKFEKINVSYHCAI